MDAVELERRRREKSIKRLKGEIDHLERDVEAQQDMQRQQLEVLVEMRDVQRRHDFNATWLGWGWNLLSAVLAVYGAKSMLDAARVLFFKMEPTTSSIIAWLSDPTSLPSRILSHLVSVPPEYIRLAVQPVSFALVFTMAVSSVPGFLNSFMKLFSSLSRDLTSNSIVLLLAEVMGSFFLAQVLQVRMTIPENRRENMIRAMGNMNFNFLYLWQHGVTLMSAITAGVLFVAYAATSYVASGGRSSSPHIFESSVIDTTGTGTGTPALDSASDVDSQRSSDTPHTGTPTPMAAFKGAGGGERGIQVAAAGGGTPDGFAASFSLGASLARGSRRPATAR